MNSHHNMHHSSLSMKDQLMTLLMFQSATSSSSSTSMGSMIYVFLLSQLIEIFIKYLPVIINFVQQKYINKIDIPVITEKVTNKESSITINIKINDANNIVGLALLDYITNFTDTKHIKYINQRFILNQTESIALNKHINVRMDEVLSTYSEDGQKQDICQIIKVFSSTYNSKQIRDFISKIHNDYVINTQNKLGDKRYYFNMRVEQFRKFDYKVAPNNFTFTMKPFTTNRKFNNLFGEEIELIKKRVKFFIENKEWYDEKGVPYTLGLLLHGEPGTGKTSCIKCLANETDRHIININLNNPITKTQLENLFFDEYIHILNPNTSTNEKYNIPLDKRIYVFEDIDCQNDIVRERNFNNYDTLDDFDNSDDNSDNNLDIRENFPKPANINVHHSLDLPSSSDVLPSSSMYNSSMCSSAVSPSYIKFTNPSKTIKTINNVKKEWKNKVKHDPRPINLKEGEGKEDEEKNELIDMSFLLNLLDGVLETPGRIIIMTSNHPETLDRAMIRPGRIDIISKFTVCSHNTIIEMIEFFYNITLNENQKKQIYLLKCNITPAEMGKLMFENFGEPDKVINKLLLN